MGAIKKKKRNLTDLYVIGVISILTLFAIFLIYNSGSEKISIVRSSAEQLILDDYPHSSTIYSLTVDEGNIEFFEGINTKVFAYNDEIPGPIIQGNVGDVIKIKVKNKLDEPTSIHWHGLQLSNTMDGVPGVTQDPIQPGEIYEYKIELRNPGLYWYHSHFEGHKQVESGLQGVILVNDPNENINVDDEAILVLDDILLGNDYQLRNFNLGRMHGRFGNYFLVNGLVDPTIQLNGGVVRLRIVNTANARSFNLQFDDEEVTVIGEDIGRVKPYSTKILTIHPGERYDLIIKASLKNIPLYHVTSRGYQKIGSLDFGEGILKEIDISSLSFEEPSFLDEAFDKAPDLHLTLQGFMQQGTLRWAIDGKYHPDTTGIYEVNEGDLIKIRLENTQGQPHPMHLHGQKFIILERNGVKNDNLVWKDTVMVGNREVVDIAFIAEEKGDWVFHCHILEHAEAGMLSILRVV